MRIYFSGIGGIGIGPLAELCQDAGYDVLGSDVADSHMTQQLRERGIEVELDQSGSFLESQHASTPIDWYVHSAAVTSDNPEFQKARELDIHTAKRDELINRIIFDKDLKLLAISGTHGKTTTTAMFVWLFEQLGAPFAHLVGTGLSYAPSGRFQEGSTYLIYEADEFDRNMLQFQPDIGVIVSLDYDHPDIYPTIADYRQAFRDFITQSRLAITWRSVLDTLSVQPGEYTVGIDDDHDLSNLQLAGEHNRRNAFLVASIALSMLDQQGDPHEIFDILEHFPGSQRRFEKLADNLYTDYGHHPTEIAAMLQLAREVAEHVVLIYQPHQNSRQHEVRDQYSDELFRDADEIYWLPTYLSREDPQLEILTPQQLTTHISSHKVHAADMDEALWETITTCRNEGKLVLCMGAGSIDAWVRDKLTA